VSAVPRVLLLSSLFPSEARPRHGIFVETRLRHLRRLAPLDVRVIAPVPWFPSAHPRFGAYARFAATPRHALREGVPVAHPRYLMLPRVGMAWQPGAMARAVLAQLARWRREGWSPDLIDAHYLYPDGVAAARVARTLDLPLLMTARGTDVNVIARLPGPGAAIRDAAAAAHAVISVSAGLRDGLAALGVDPQRLVVLRNGVDTERFRPADSVAARAALGLPPTGLVIAAVGNLVPEKGQALAIEALAALPGATLLIVGDGPCREALAAQARDAGVDARVRFLPVMPQEALAQVYSAADQLWLTSQREGWPNVVLEAMACGAVVQATDVGAVREMITAPTLGRVLETRDPLAWAASAAALRTARAPREAVRAHACTYGWDEVSEGQLALFRAALSAPGTGRAA
jgi:glycosyltransferase involved in cell wall biosynthesis